MSEWHKECGGQVVFYDGATTHDPVYVCSGCNKEWTNSDDMEGEVE